MRYLAFAALLFASCSVETAVGPDGEDGGGPRTDGGRRDAQAPDDAPRADRVGMPDGGELDGNGVTDGGVDGGPPDAGPPDAGRPPCDDLYGSAENYDLCEETETTCRFYFDPSVNSPCDGVCGARCVESYAESSADHCLSSTTSRACSFAAGDQICLCARME